MTRRLALLGSPVDQALSPVLHRAAYAALGLDWRYEALDVAAEDLPAFLDGPGRTWQGFSLTMPLKTAAVALLDEASETVQQTRTVNTLTVRGGRLHGDNTDLHGMLRALHDADVAAARTVTVLGAGATARTALAAARTLHCPHVVALARDPQRAGPLAATADRLGLGLEIRPWQLPGDALHAELVIAAVPPGAGDELAEAWARPAGTLLDVVYRPWPTQLARAARAAGARVISGLPMLIHQAARQVETQTGYQAPFPAMLQAAMRHFTASNQEGRSA